MVDMRQPDPWPVDIKRSWEFSITFKGLDGSTINRTYIAHEKDRVNEFFMQFLIETVTGGWSITSHLAKRHFNFEEMPPFGAKILAFKRLQITQDTV